MCVWGGGGEGGGAEGGGRRGEEGDWRDIYMLQI